MSNVEFAVFAKPWKALTIPQLGTHIRTLGFDLIELPVREGFAVEPEHIERDLPKAVRDLADAGVRVLNVSCSLPLDDERVFAACAEAGVPLNRVIFRLDGLDYWEAEDRARRELDAALPLCARYGVKIGVQNHYGPTVPNTAMGLHHLVADYDPKYVGAVFDPAHNGLQGEDPEPAFDIVRSHLAFVNLKNSYWQRLEGPEATSATWAPYWTTGRHGRTSWPRVAAKLAAIGYQGAICFSAEYTAQHDVDRLIVEDLAYATTVFGQAA